MNANKYTKRSMEAIQDAQSIALSHNHQQIEQLLAYQATYQDVEDSMNFLKSLS